MAQKELIKTDINDEESVDNIKGKTDKNLIPRIISRDIPTNKPVFSSSNMEKMAINSYKKSQK